MNTFASFAHPTTECKTAIATIFLGGFIIDGGLFIPMEWS